VQIHRRAAQHGFTYNPGISVLAFRLIFSVHLHTWSAPGTSGRPRAPRSAPPRSGGRSDRERDAQHRSRPHRPPSACRLIAGPSRRAGTGCSCMIARPRSVGSTAAIIPQGSQSIIKSESPIYPPTRPVCQAHPLSSKEGDGPSPNAPPLDPPSKRGNLTQSQDKAPPGVHATHASLVVGCAIPGWALSR